MRIATRIKLTVVAAAAAAALAVGAGAASAQEPAGKQVYDQMCAKCHGATGAGNEARARAIHVEPKLLNLGTPGKMSREELRAAILNGKNKMPAYKNKLQPQQVDPLVDYVQGLMAACAPAAK